MASSSSSAKARNASSVTHRARSRATSLVTSGAMAAGVERRVATSACSRPTPTVRTPARERVHSSIDSSRSIRACTVLRDSPSRRATIGRVGACRQVKTMTKTSTTSNRKSAPMMPSDSGMVASTMGTAPRRPAQDRKSW